jgi:rubrerythrin
MKRTIRMPSTSEIAASDRLSFDMTLAEILDLAMDFELTAHRFYSGLIEKARPEVRPLVHELAAEEKAHYELLQRLSSDKDLVHHLRHGTKKPPTTEAFGDYVDLPPEPHELLEDNLLEYAKSRERIAYEHYAYLAEITPAGPVKDLFELLRDEEEGHTRALERRWSTMFSIF